MSLKGRDEQIEKIGKKRHNGRFLKKNRNKLRRNAMKKEKGFHDKNIMDGNINSKKRIYK